METHTLKALKAAKRIIDDLAALHWPDMYSYEAVERATQRVDVAAVADALQLINDALKSAPVAEPVAWISFNALTKKEYMQRLPIQSMQAGVYKHTPLYTHPAIATLEPMPQVPASEAARYRKLHHCFSDLYAMVKGECPSLLEDYFMTEKYDSALEDAAIDTAMGAQTEAPVAEPAGNDISYVYQICNRYESGYGHGIKRDGLDLSKTPHADSVMGEAYQIGYEAGSEKFTEPTPQDQALQELAEREAFSRWAMLEGNDEMYLKSAWEGWQAALQSRPKLSDYVIADIIEKLNPFYASYSDAHQEKWVECARAVIAADREMK